MKSGNKEDKAVRNLSNTQQGYGVMLAWMPNDCDIFDFSSTIAI